MSVLPKSRFARIFSVVILALCAALPAFSQEITARAAARVLDQASWGPTPASVAEVQQMGINAWLNAQFALNTSDIPDQPILDSAGNLYGTNKGGGAKHNGAVFKLTGAALVR